YFYPLDLPSFPTRRSSDLPAGITAGVLFVISFVFALNGMIKIIYHFDGVGKPVSIEDLKSEILKINSYDCPVMVKEKGNKLIVRSEEHTSELQSRENLVCR